MTFDYKILGKKLKEARESLLLSPKDAATKIEVKPDEYLEFEQGINKITGNQLILLIDFYQRDFRYFVTGDYPSAESQVQEMFRCNAALSQKDRMAIQKFVRLCEYEDFLEREIFKQKKVVLPDYSQRNFGHNYLKKQSEEIANEERNRLNLKNKPINNIFDLLREQGIHIFKRRLEDQNISGLYINHPNAGHCILINYLDDIYRQNFSAAHEYCHALFDSSKGQEITYFDKKDNKLEWRANSFAGNFLIPKNTLESDYSRQENYEQWKNMILEIAKKFFVSSQVVIIRLSEMKWIDKDLKQKLRNDKNLVIKSHQKFDPEIPPDLSPGFKNKLTKIIMNGLSWHFIELCTQAYRDGEITYHKLLDMLMLPLQEGTEILNEIPTFMEVGE